MNILFVNPHFKIGGIATSLYNLIEELNKDSSLKIDLVCFNPYVDDKFKCVTNWAKIKSPFLLKCSFISIKEAIKNLSKSHIILFFILKVFSKIIGVNRYRKVICKYVYTHKKKYDAAISFSNDIPLKKANFTGNDFVEFSVNALIKISYIHNDLERLGITRDYSLKRYQNFDKIVTVSESCKSTFDKLVPEYITKSYLAHNFMNPEIILKKGEMQFESPFTKDNISFITVARLDNNQKRIDKIISVAKKLKEHNFIFSWHIIGNGQDLEYLKSLSIKSNVDDFVHFLGFIHNPYPYIKHADCFVLTSDFEAQGMVLSEALILGTPVVTTNFEAAKEFVIPTINGFITEKSTSSIYPILENILNDPSILKTLRKKIKTTNANYNSQKALKEFFTLIEHS